MLSEFYDKIQKYKKSLRVGGSGSARKVAFWKMHWHIAHSDDVDEFRKSIEAHIEAMTALMITANS